MREQAQLKPVIQDELTGCGIASVAAIAGVSYTKAKQVANRLGIHAADDKLWSETSHVRKLLKHFCLPIPRRDPFLILGSAAQSRPAYDQVARGEGAPI